MKTDIHEDKKATEYLANERTFLAWVRTSIAVISLGFVVAKFSVWMRELALRISPGTPISNSGMSLPIGLSMMAFGAILAILAAWHYHLVNKALEQGTITANRGLVIIVTAAIVILATLTIIYLIITSEHL